LSTEKQVPAFKFPSLFSKKKDEDWHKKFVNAIANQSINGSYSLRYAAIQEAYEFYLGLNTGGEFTFLQQAEDGESLPAQWMNFNRIKSKIELLLGELMERGYEINVTGLNKEIKSAKLEERLRLIAEMKWARISSQLEDMYGLPLGSEDEEIPQDMDEVESFMENYKELSELIMETILRYLDKRNKWNYERVALFRDVLIAGMCFIRNEIVNGIPQTRRIDPRYMVWDMNAQDDYLQDSTYFGEIRYMNIADACEQYGLSEKELKASYGRYTGITTPTITPPSFADISSYGNGQNLKMYRQENGELRVLVVSACWVDYEDHKAKVTKDKYGNEHTKRMSKKDKVGDGDEVVGGRIKIWRQGTLIGGEYLKEWGKVPNQPVNSENLQETECPYKGFIPHYLNGTSVSKVQQLQSLQKLKNIAMYNLQLAMARSGPKGFVYDVAQMPDNFKVSTVMKYLKTAGIAFINSAKDGYRASYNQFGPIDLSLGNEINKYLEISAMLDNEMDSISGINEARQGIVQSSSQAVGVTQSALMQSNLQTATYFKLFYGFCTNVWNHLGGLAKIACQDRERFAPIVGDLGIDFLEVDEPFELYDYGVFIEEVPAAFQNIANFHALIQAALQSQQLDFVQAMKLMLEKDVRQGVLRFEKEIARKQKQMAEQAQAQQAAEAEAAQNLEQMRNQALQQQTEGKLAEVEMKNKGAMDTALTKGRVALNAQKMRWQQKLDELNAKQ
jgi:hypothetical protein